MNKKRMKKRIEALETESLYLVEWLNDLAINVTDIQSYVNGEKAKRISLDELIEETKEHKPTIDHDLKNKAKTTIVVDEGLIDALDLRVLMRIMAGVDSAWVGASNALENVILNASNSEKRTTKDSIAPKLEEKKLTDQEEIMGFFDKIGVEYDCGTTDGSNLCISIEAYNNISFVFDIKGSFAELI